MAQSSKTNQTTEFVETLGNITNIVLATTVYPSCTTEELGTLNNHSKRLTVRTLLDRVSIRI